MKRYLAHAAFAALLICAPLASCATSGGVPGAHAAAERADTDASLLYAAIASAVNQYKAAPTTTDIQKAEAEALKVKAWAALGLVHQAYASNVVASLDVLSALLHQAQALGAH